MTKPKLLLFDLGNVLVRFEPDRFSRALGLSIQDARNHYEQGVRELTNRYESGKSSTEEYLTTLRTFLNDRFDIPALRVAFLSVLTDPIPGMENLVWRATAIIPSALVSNTNELHFSTILPRVPALKQLPKCYLSYELGVVKPLPEFYQYIVDHENVEPDQMLFIDDVAENVAAAERAGMVGFHFDGAERLEEHLKKVGVLK